MIKILFFLMLSISIHAHDNSKMQKRPHGGIIKSASLYQLELVQLPNKKMKIYFLDEQNNTLNLSKSHITMTYVNNIKGFKSAICSNKKTYYECFFDHRVPFNDRQGYLEILSSVDNKFGRIVEYLLPFSINNKKRRTQ